MGFFRKKKDRELDRMRKLLGEFVLPTFPSNTMQVLSLLRAPNSGVKEICARLEMDPALHIKILRTVNSAAFGLGKKVSNLDHAIRLLGRARLESTVLSTVVSQSLPSFQVGEFNHNKFWLFSSRRAALSRLLAHRLHPKTQVESFTAAFLIDIAVAVIASVKKERYCELWFQAKEQGRIEEILKLESQLLTFNHCELGAILGETWELPRFLIENIRNHHNPTSHLVQPSVHIVSTIFNEDKAACHDLLEARCSEAYAIPSEELKSLVDKAFDAAGEFHSLMM